MPLAFCPRCRGSKNMRISVSRRTGTGPDGKPTQVETRSFHCESCHYFVRSEDREIPRAK